jgi:hypothetical protein
MVAVAVLKERFVPYKVIQVFGARGPGTNEAPLTMPEAEYEGPVLWAWSERTRIAGRSSRPSKLLIVTRIRRFVE